MITKIVVRALRDMAKAEVGREKYFFEVLGQRRPERDVSWSRPV